MEGHNVAVLLAAYNGMAWIDEQIESILLQERVNVHLFISVDISSDDTYNHCLTLAEKYKNVQVLPYGMKFGGAARNFYRLINDVDLTEFDYVSFADQDDIWKVNKLSRAIEVLTEGHYDCFSSNVTAFWKDGRRVLIKKSQKQVEYDFFFESGGPGCTHVLTSSVANNLKAFIQGRRDRVDQIALHDWLIYAYARANGYKWVIDSWPGMLYRQHDSNQFGANGGFEAIVRRLKMIRNKWYLTEIRRIAKVLDKERLPFLVKCLDRGYIGHIYMALNINKVRRKPLDRVTLALLLILGLMK
ncbi:glycosyltransferase [Pantoea ananatis]